MADKDTYKDKDADKDAGADADADADTDADALMLTVDNIGRSGRSSDHNAYLQEVGGLGQSHRGVDSIEQHRLTLRTRQRRMTVSSLHLCVYHIIYLCLLVVFNK